MLTRRGHCELYCTLSAKMDELLLPIIPRLLPFCASTLIYYLSLCRARQSHDRVETASVLARVRLKIYITESCRRLDQLLVSYDTIAGMVLK